MYLLPSAVSVLRRVNAIHPALTTFLDLETCVLLYGRYVLKKRSKPDGMPADDKCFFFQGESKVTEFAHPFQTIRIHGLIP
mmetsp:Transcript_29661/g.36103  ORF Transcript_29661/g.36103 Transcript_29661/m.36103 type:complete len:81 (+) Transcript_29661:1287-1529(+)